MKNLGFWGKTIIIYLIMILSIVTYHAVSTNIAGKEIETKISGFSSEKGNPIVVEKLGREYSYKDSKTGEKLDSVYKGKYEYKIQDSKDDFIKYLGESNFVFTEKGVYYYKKTFNFFETSFLHRFSGNELELTDLNFEDNYLISFLRNLLVDGDFVILQYLFLTPCFAIFLKDKLRENIFLKKSIDLELISQETDEGNKIITGQDIRKGYISPKPFYNIYHNLQETDENKFNEVDKLIDKDMKYNLRFGTLVFYYLFLFMVITILTRISVFNIGIDILLLVTIISLSFLATKYLSFKMIFKEYNYHITKLDDYLMDLFKK